MIRKLGLPGDEEYAIGTIGPGNILVLNEDAIHMFGVNSAQVDQLIQKEAKELKRRMDLLRGARPFPILEGKTIILVDDGLTTDSIELSAIQVLEKMHVKKVILAVPICTHESEQSLLFEVDHLDCLYSPSELESVSSCYQDFRQTSDQEVIDLLNMAIRVEC